MALHQPTIAGPSPLQCVNIIEAKNGFDESASDSKSIVHKRCITNFHHNFQLSEVLL